MSGYDLVRSWKDPDERGDTAHPAGDITLDRLSGALAQQRPIGDSFWWPNCNDTLCVYCPIDLPQF